MPDRILQVILLLLLASSCTGPGSRQAPPKTTYDSPGKPRPLSGHVEYRVDPAQSELRLLVYRAGPLARVGHNHVIVNRGLTGWVDVAPKIAASSFMLSVPTVDFVVDDARMRLEEGADFPGDVDAGAKSGTQRNLQSEALLDGARHSIITVKSLEINGTDAALMATLAVNVAGHESKIIVPFSLERGAGRLLAAGNLGLRQSALGLTPFSVMWGALQVQDEMRLKFRIVARVN